MAINVVHSDPSSIATAMGAAGRGVFRLRQRQENRDDAKFLLGLQQRDQEFAAQLGAQADNQALQRERFYAGRAFDAAQRQDYLRAQEAAHVQNQQFDLVQDQVDFEQQRQLQDEQAARVTVQQGIQSAEQAANDALAQYRTVKFDPEGKRRFNELAGSLRSIKAQRGVTLNERQFQDVVGQWMDDWQKADLGQYEIKELTVEEWWQQTTRTDADGAVFGKDRAGMPRKLKDAPFVPLTPAEIEANTHSYPDGTRLFVNPRTGKETVIPPAKPSAHEGPKLDLSQDDLQRLHKAIRSSLIDEWNAEVRAADRNDDGNLMNPMEPLADYIRRRMPEEIADYTRRWGHAEEGAPTPSDAAPVFEPQIGSQPQSTMAPPDLGDGLGGFDAGGQQPAIDAGMQAQAIHDASSPPAIVITERGQAEALGVGAVFTFAGRRYLKTGPQSADELPSNGPTASSHASIAGAGTEDAPFDLRDLDDESAMHTVKAVPTGAVFIDEVGRRWVK